MKAETPGKHKLCSAHKTNPTCPQFSSLLGNKELSCVEGLPGFHRPLLCKKSHYPSHRTHTTSPKSSLVSSQKTLRFWSCLNPSGLLSQRWGGLINKHLFLTVLEAEESNIKRQKSQCLVRAHLLVHRLDCFRVHARWEGQGRSPESLSQRHNSHSWRFYSCDLITSHLTPPTPSP